jgi:hypothetical protein
MHTALLADEPSGITNKAHAGLTHDLDAIKDLLLGHSVVTDAVPTGPETATTRNNLREREQYVKDLSIESAFVL